MQGTPTPPLRAALSDVESVAAPADSAAATAIATTAVAASAVAPLVAPRTTPSIPPALTTEASRHRVPRAVHFRRGSMLDAPADSPDDGESDDSVVFMELMGKTRGESTTDARRRTNAFKLYQAPIDATRSAASSPRGRAQDSGAASEGITLVEQLQARYVSPEVQNILSGVDGKGG